MPRTSTGTSLRVTVATVTEAASAFLLADCTFAVEQPGVIRQTAGSAASAANIFGLKRISGDSFPHHAEEKLDVVVDAGLRPSQHPLSDQPAGHVVNHQRGGLRASDADLSQPGRLFEDALQHPGLLGVHIAKLFGNRRRAEHVAEFRIVDFEEVAILLAIADSGVDKRAHL